MDEAMAGVRKGREGKGKGRGRRGIEGKEREGLEGKTGRPR